MGDQSPRAVGLARPRWRAYILLARVSNLPTVWTNVLAGTVGVRLDFEVSTLVRTAFAASLFYAGGMFLNDAFDADSDRLERPERPIPSGAVARTEAATAGAVFIGAGLVLLLAFSPLTLLFGLLLAGAIVAYDYRHKHNPLAPVLMGACRALVYCVAAAAAGELSPLVVGGAAVLWVYVSGLTVVARAFGSAARWVVPAAIAAISLVDAGFVAIASRSVPLSLVAASGFGLTLLLQRFVPGD